MLKDFQKRKFGQRIGRVALIDRVELLGKNLVHKSVTFSITSNECCGIKL